MERGQSELRPTSGGRDRPPPLEDLEPLSEIIPELNERFGTDFSDEDRVFISALENRIADDAALEASVRANTPENARLTFDHVVGDRLLEIVDTNFELYKRITDDEAFGKFFLDWLFQRYRQKMVESERAGDGARRIDRRILERAVELIAKEVHPKKVILFGSAARGDEDRESDLDLLVVLERVESRHREMVRIGELMRPLRVPVDVLVYSQQEVEEWGHLPGTMIYEALADGRVVYEAA